MKLILTYLSVLLIVIATSCNDGHNSSQPTATLTLDRRIITLYEGDTDTITCSLSTFSDKPIVWISSIDSICSVFNGIIIAHREGTVIITAQCDTLKAQCAVVVKRKTTNDPNDPTDPTDPTDPDHPTYTDIIAPAGYTMVWSDEFDGSTLNTDIWNIENTNSGCGNAELEYYCERGVSVGKEPTSGANCLILTARREEYQGSHCTSGRINTLGKYSFTHGAIEAYIKLPKTANGLWPAFWMMGADINTNSWPRCGEIDILEMGHSDGIRQGTQDRYFNGACHWGYYIDNQYPNYANASTAAYSLQDDAFHLFTLIWDDSHLRMYLDRHIYPDNAPYFEMSIYDTNGEWATGNYFHKPCFILFNLAIGGNFTGIWDINAITALADGSQSMYVDFVRVYQK